MSNNVVYSESPPRAPGFYFLRRAGKPDTVVRVGNDGTAAVFSMTVPLQKLVNEGGEWAGPLTLPVAAEKKNGDEDGP